MEHCTRSTTARVLPPCAGGALGPPGYFAGATDPCPPRKFCGKGRGIPSSFLRRGRGPIPQTIRSPYTVGPPAVRAARIARTRPGGHPGQNPYRFQPSRRTATPAAPHTVSAGAHARPPVLEVTALPSSAPFRLLGKASRPGPFLSRRGDFDCLHANKLTQSPNPRVSLRTSSIYRMPQLRNFLNAPIAESRVFSP